MKTSINTDHFVSLIQNSNSKQDILTHKANFNSEIQAIFKQMKSLSVEEKKAQGEDLNNAKNTIELAIKKALENLRIKEIEIELSKEDIDISLKSFSSNFGSIHPVTMVQQEIVEIMQKYGFTLTSGPEIETNYYNFDALNIKKNHPSRDMHDTFYLDFLNKDSENFLLRTHTSCTQIRGMQNSKPPFALISTGRTYRCDFDKTHTPMFNQLECLLVDKNVSMSNLLWMIERLFSEFFQNTKVDIRLRPSYFPFTEPSAEVDINIGNGFLEVMGAGMVHPNVLIECGIDPKEYSGFAFGVGIERLAMLKYNIQDLRDFFSSNSKWTQSYGFTL